MLFQNKGEEFCSRAQWLEGSGDDGMGTTKRIAYLVSEYPALSHTFVEREVHTLRRLGMDVKTCSVRVPGRGRSDGDESTFYLQAASTVAMVLSHLWLLGQHPLKYLDMMVFSARMRGRGIMKRAGYFVEAVLLLRWLRRQRMNHVHVHFANPAATVALIAARSGQTTFSLSVHGPDEFCNELADVVPQKLEHASFVRCISLFCRSQVMRLISPELWRKLHVIRCGVNVQEFEPRPEPHNRITEFVSVGRLVPAKGFHVLLEAIQALSQRRIAFHVTIVGGGQEEEKLGETSRRMGIEQYVTFMGALNQQGVHEALNRADAMVLASFAEGLPVVLMEAMAKGIPCVSTRIAGVPELIEDGVNGYLVAPSDADGLAQRMQELAEDTELRQAMGCRARQRVLAEYELEFNCRKLYSLFETVG